VCADGTQLLGDFQFGDITPAVPLPVGTTIGIDVFVGAEVACDSPDEPTISQDVTVPDGDVALVATAGPGGDPELAPLLLNTSTPEGCSLVNGAAPA
jgi:hypothetical protein